MVACGPAPVIGYVLGELRQAGITDILLVSRSGKSMLEDFVFESWPGACVIRQPEQKGLGDAVALARRWVGDHPFVVALGDTIIQSNASAPASPLMRMIRAVPSPESSVVLVREVKPELLNRYGIVDPVEMPAGGEVSFMLRDIIEKPSLEAAPSRWAVAGRYIFSPAVFDALNEICPAADGEIQLTDAMRRLCRTSGGLYASALLPGERRFDIGSFDSYYEAFQALSCSTAGQPEERK